MATSAEFDGNRCPFRVINVGSAMSAHNPLTPRLQPSLQTSQIADKGQKRTCNAIAGKVGWSSRATRWRFGDDRAREETHGWMYVWLSPI